MHHALFTTLILIALFLDTATSDPAVESANETTDGSAEEHDHNLLYNDRETFLIYDTYHTEQLNSQRRTLLRMFETAEFVGTLPGVNLTLVVPRLRELLGPNVSATDNWDDLEVEYSRPSRYFGIAEAHQRTHAAFDIMDIEDYLSLPVDSAPTSRSRPAVEPLLWITNVPRKAWTRSSKATSANGAERHAMGTYQFSRYMHLCPERGGRRPFRYDPTQPTRLGLETEQVVERNTNFGIESMKDGKVSLEFSGLRISAEKILCRPSSWGVDMYHDLGYKLRELGSIVLPELALSTSIYRDPVMGHKIKRESDMHPFQFKFVAGLRFNGEYLAAAREHLARHLGHGRRDFAAVHWRVGDFETLYGDSARTGEGLEQASVFGTVGGPPKVFLRKEEVLDAISRKFRDVGRHGVTRWYVSTNGGPEWKWLQDALDKKVELWRTLNLSGGSAMLPRFQGREEPVDVPAAWFESGKVSADETMSGDESIPMVSLRPMVSAREVAIVEQHVCALAAHFFGTFRSSFSQTVHEMRLWQTWPSENSLEGRGAVQQMLPDMIGPLVPLQGGIAGYKAGEQLEYVGGLIMPKGQDKDSGLRRKNFAEF